MLTAKDWCIMEPDHLYTRPKQVQEREKAHAGSCQQHTINTYRKNPDVIMETVKVKLKGLAQS